jgi:hypothetical protein
MKAYGGFSIASMALLLTLAGCGRGFFQFGERAAWRHEAEVTCLKSGEVKLGAGVVQIEPIEGPGMCGADFPLKVTVLGGEYSPSLSYADDLPPSGRIADGQASQTTPWPARKTPASPSQPIEIHQLQGPAPSNGPMRWITGPPGIDQSQTAAPQPLGHPANDTVSDSIEQRAAKPQTLYNDPTDEPSHRAEPPARGTAGGQQIAIAAPPVALSPPATLACPIVSALDRWISEGVQPAALHWFGKPVLKIQQISAYSCRGMVGSGNSTISEHAFGNALDIASFTLADGRSITVKDGWQGTPEEQGFLHDVQLYACDTFTTVLAPGYNVYHYNHIHVDLMRRESGRRPCRPNAIPGEVAAAKARVQYAGRAQSTAYTVSISEQRSSSFRQRLPGEDGDDEDDHGG